ncbi:hypothetical protein GW17_00058794 [Ensete ventricosum]|nr:hypothetical protein GW17_00058794 [Ensete ventricosum]
MRLKTRLECIGSPPRVSGVCQDSTREFTGRRPRLARRLSGVAEKLAVSWKVGTRREFARRFVERIGKLDGNTSGDRRQKAGRIIAQISKAT